MEQIIKINAFSDDFGLIGEFRISKELSDFNSYNFNLNEVEVSEYISLTNVPIINDFDNTTPIQFFRNSYNGVNILLLEEMEYAVSFNFSESFLNKLSNLSSNNLKGDKFQFNLSNCDVFYSLLNGMFSESPLKLLPGSNYGFLNFKSFAGKSFIDIRLDDKFIFSIPIEVRSRKMDYNNQYPAMIADLSKYSSGLIFEVESPLFQSFELNNSKKDTFYEDFMLLEYLFREENLPSVFEYLSRDLYSILDDSFESVPSSFASNIGPNDLINLFSNPEYLYKDEDSNISLSKKMNGYVPLRLNTTTYVDNINIPENQFYKSFLEFIDFLINKLLKNCQNGYVRDKLLEYEDIISYFLSQKYFNEISIMDYAPLNSQVLQKREGYRDILKYYLMFEFGFRLSWNQVTDEFKGYEKKLSRLYEYWCYFKLIDIIDSLTDSKSTFDDIFSINSNNWSIKLKEGIIKEFKLCLGDKYVVLNLMYNKSFTKYSKDYNSYSISYRPDYSLELIFDNKRHIIHFDAKYKIDFGDDAAKKEDITKMHAYKEAIKDTIGSFVLFPGEKEEIFWNYDGSIGVGAFPLTPGNDKKEKLKLVDFIKNVILKLI